jgi:hypothetical protein
MVKDSAKKLGKFVVRTWDGIYLGPDEGGDGHRIYDSQTKRFNNSHDVFFLKGRARPEFHSSPLIEKIPAPIADEESKSDVDLEGEETRPSSITLRTSSKRDIRTHSDYHVEKQGGVHNLLENKCRGGERRGSCYGTTGMFI